MVEVKDVVKRAFDISISAILLILLSPVMLVLSVLIWREMGRPILFCQFRVGRMGKTFKMIKFRTMTNIVEGGDECQLDADRITPFGAMLRSTSLDELPELWNVLKGEMSLVGPRPLLIEYLPLYTNEQARRHEVRPGITGVAQVNGRNGISWKKKFSFDVWYVDNRSIWVDLAVLSKTVGKVLSREGVSSEGQATAEKFKGADQQRD